jgi:hypothetical protein
VNDPTVFRRDCFKPNCATTLFNQRDSSGGNLRGTGSHVGGQLPVLVYPANPIQKGNGGCCDVIQTDVAVGDGDQLGRVPNAG